MEFLISKKADVDEIIENMFTAIEYIQDEYGVPSNKLLVFAVHHEIENKLFQKVKEHPKYHAIENIEEPGLSQLICPRILVNGVPVIVSTVLEDRDGQFYPENYYISILI